MGKVVDVLIIGAGAAGLMCAAQAGKRGRCVLVIDHANKAGKKILMSGGGHCNFTNTRVLPRHFISHNPHFCKSALSRYTPEDFIELVSRYKIPFHEKKMGQLFCDNKSKDIVNMLLKECHLASANIKLNVSINQVSQTDGGCWQVMTSIGQINADSLVVATGGLSIPSMGATGFGYHLAQQFDIPVYPTRPGLVPFTLHPEDKSLLSPLSGISFSCCVHNSITSFSEDMLITHRGLSGPAMLQISSYWQPGELITIDMLPGYDLLAWLKAQREKYPKFLLKKVLSQWWPKRLVASWLGDDWSDCDLSHLSNKDLVSLAKKFKSWQVKPCGTEGYRTAEVTLGGVDCNCICSKTFECRDIPGLFFIGEVLDVTGWLGGYNFQWAWASSVAAGNYV